MCGTHHTRRTKNGEQDVQKQVHGESSRKEHLRIPRKLCFKVLSQLQLNAGERNPGTMLVTQLCNSMKQPGALDAPPEAAAGRPPAWQVTHCGQKACALDIVTRLFWSFALRQARHQDKVGAKVARKTYHNLDHISECAVLQERANAPVR